MIALSVQITTLIDTSFPGIVECRTIDAWGKEWVFNEKLPVVTPADLGRDSAYPQPGLIACVELKRWRDFEGREIITVTTEKPWGIASIDGVDRFDVLQQQLVEI